MRIVFKVLKKSPLTLLKKFESTVKRMGNTMVHSLVWNTEKFYFFYMSTYYIVICYRLPIKKNITIEYWVFEYTNLITFYSPMISAVWTEFSRRFEFAKLSAFSWYMDNNILWYLPTGIIVNNCFKKQLTTVNNFNKTVSIGTCFNRNETLPLTVPSVKSFSIIRQWHIRAT